MIAGSALYLISSMKFRFNAKLVAGNLTVGTINRLERIEISMNRETVYLCDV